jgi:hypothetical protein
MIQDKKKQALKIEELTLRPKVTKMQWILLYKFVSILSVCWTLVVLATQVTLIFNIKFTIVNFFIETQRENPVITFLFSLFFLGGMVLNCLFTIFNLKISDFL